jgi:hypothetical protein
MFDPIAWAGSQPPGARRVTQRGNADRQRPSGPGAAAIAGALLAAALATGSGCTAPPIRTQTSVDPGPATNAPDRFAWDLFIQINRPALERQRGVADPRKSPGDPGLRVWETWKISTPAGSEVFLRDGSRPAGWETAQATEHGVVRKFLSPRKFKVTNPPAVLDFGIESRINRPGFEFIVEQGLYSIDGQERFRASGKDLDFPVDTVAVKASWIRFTPEEVQRGRPSRFYTSVDPDGNVYGLTGLHITSKAIPKWLWASFEQVDNDPPEVPDRDRHTRPLAPEDGGTAEPRMRAVPVPLRGTVWRYYVLRGTQTDFTDASGRPVILGNTQLEGGLQKTASCMSCHARATIGDRMDDVRAPQPGGKLPHPPESFVPPDGRIGAEGANRLTVDPDDNRRESNPALPSRSANGAPDPTWFADPATGRSRYTQLDFLWEFTFAHRESGALESVGR